MINSLGDFLFVSFHHPQDHGAPPLLPAQQGEIVQRPGADGTSVLRLGVKSEPFQMRSMVDVLSFYDANILMGLYMASQNTGAYRLIWGGVDYTFNFGALFIPLRVEPIRIRRVSAATGGLTLGATAIVEALWTLQSVYPFIDEDA